MVHLGVRVTRREYIGKEWVQVSVASLHRSSSVIAYRRKLLAVGSGPTIGIFSKIDLLVTGGHVGRREGQDQAAGEVLRCG